MMYKLLRLEVTGACAPVPSRWWYAGETATGHIGDMSSRFTSTSKVAGPRSSGMRAAGPRSSGMA